MLGRHVGHDSCCCSAVSEPANGLSKLVSAMGRCGRSFVFFTVSVRNVRDSGRCAGKACWARFLLLFGCFGTSQWTLKAGFCNGVWQKLCFFRASVRDVRDSGALCWEGMLGTIPAAVRLFPNQAMDSQSWFLQ